VYKFIEKYLKGGNTMKSPLHCPHKKNCKHFFAIQSVSPNNCPCDACHTSCHYLADWNPERDSVSGTADGEPHCDDSIFTRIAMLIVWPAAFVSKLRLTRK
jgi:hypothetical protein